MAVDDPFEGYDPEEQEHEVSRAALLLRAADAADIKLSAIQVARVLGYEETRHLRSFLEKVKEVLPGFSSAKQRFNKAVGELHQQGLWDNTERDSQISLRTWFEGLTEAQRAGLEVQPQGGGPAFMRAMTLATTDGSGAEFDFGHSFELPADVMSRLSSDQQALVTNKRAFWEPVGVHNGAALADFLDDHFEHDALDTKKLPKEVGWLVGRDPRAAALIEEFAGSGTPLTLSRCKQTPEAVLDAIRHIAVRSQHKYVTTWLPHLLREESRPKVLERDREAVRRGYEILGHATLKMTEEGSFRRALLTSMFGEKLVEDLDFNASIELIQEFKPMVLSLQTDGAVTPDQQRRLADVNDVLAGSLAPEYARRRLVEDDANRTSEKAQTIIKVLAVVGPASEVLQEVMHLGGLAKFIAASGDDLAGEAAEISALKGAGLTTEELVQRLKVIAPVAVVAFAIASGVDKVQRTVSDRVAGTMFSSAAVLLSGVTGVLSVKYFADNYTKLAAEGKLHDRLPTDPAFLDHMKSIGSEQVSEEDILATIESALASAGLEGLEKEELMGQMRHEAAGEKFQELLGACNSPAARERYLAGLKEATGVNPARLGLTVGTYSAPLFGFLLGPIFLKSPLAYAVAGSYETLCGAAAIFAFNATSRIRWNHYIDGHGPDLAPVVALSGKATPRSRDGTPGLTRAEGPAHVETVSRPAEGRDVG